MTVAAHEEIVGMIPLEIPENPREPFGVIRLPDLYTPVTDRGLCLAFKAMLAHYRVSELKAERPKDKKPIGMQIDKAHAVVLSRTRWTIKQDHVEIVGDSGSVYRTRPDFCEGAPRPTKQGKTTICQGFSRAAVACYHLIAVEMLRLAQELDPPVAALTVTDEPEPQLELAQIAADEPTPAPMPEPTPALAEIGRAAIDGFALFAILGHLRVIQTRTQAETVDLSLTPEAKNLCLAIGEHCGVAPAEIIGSAFATIRAEEFGQLWQAIRPIGMELQQATIAVAVGDDFVGTLTITGDDLAVSVTVGAVPL